MGIVLTFAFEVMKTHENVSNQRRKMMSCKMSKDLRTKYNCRSVPVRKGDTVKILRGCSKYGGKGADGKVITVYRRRWCIHVERLSETREAAAPCKCQSTHPTA